MAIGQVNKADNKKPAGAGAGAGAAADKKGPAAPAAKETKPAAAAKK
eukprot:CAMPEP_0184680466 /NCGR_PEP_ID=MMETSP0312-20130426/3344_1 /TAXON_ID=31354 /ORGANISM="Compsopogon coeruleus, Strain SAG 36.94" /LENGTH=46 /DNA_ID= /DNA_START= /DNA_END= /DNA_ORIENTATION=